YVAGGARRRARRARGLHAPADEAVPRPLPRADRQRAPVAAARLPGDAGDRRRARGRRGDDRRDRPPRRRGRRQRARAAPGAGAGRAAGVAGRPDPRRRAPAATGGGARAVRALISVYDKTGVDELGRGLVELGWELVASGGTAAYLEIQGLPV